MYIEPQILRIHEICRVVGLSKPTVYREICRCRRAEQADRLPRDEAGHISAADSTRSLRGRNDRSEKAGNRGQIFSIWRCIVVLFAEKSGKYGPILPLSQ